MIEHIIFGASPPPPPASSFLDEVAAAIIARHQALLPNLSAIEIVIAPRASSALKHALAKAAAAHGAAAIMLPRVATVSEFAAFHGGNVHNTTPLAVAPRVVPTSERVLDIFQLIKKQKWFSPGETLALSRELVRLADELTQNIVALPMTLDEHSAKLQRAYAVSKQNTDFSFEAKLTYEIWLQLAKPAADTIDAPARYAMQLAAWAASIINAANPTNTPPLYVVGSQTFTKGELTFLSRIGERESGGAGVVMFEQSLDHALQKTIKSQFIASAFSGAPGVELAASMVTAAIAAATVRRGQFSAALLNQSIECYAAQDVEDEAGAALAKIKIWLAAGKRDIAVVALDRLSARRLRALAERDQILMSDEIGWPYSTTVSATAIMAWLDAKRDGFYFATLIDLIKSPFIFADLSSAWGRERVKLAVLLIERAIRRAGVVAGLMRMREAVLKYSSDHDAHENRDHVSTDAIQLLDRLIAADRAFNNARRSAAEWMDALQQSLVTLGLDVGLSRDAAGAGLLKILQTARDDIAASQVKLSSSEWTDWLRTLIEEARFRDESISSPIVMTSLDATRYRQFDAVILIGASESNLPGKPATTGIFNQSVRATLGLKTFRDDLALITRDLFGVLTASDACWVSWQHHAGAEPENPSPWIAALMLEAKRFGFTLTALNAQNLHKQNSKPRSGRESTGICASKPAPVLELNQIPARISASGYQSLIDCPYQYFSRAVLKLTEPDDVQEEMEKRDFGEFVHDILNRFHLRFPVITGLDMPMLKAALAEETRAVFLNALQQNFIARAWRLQWESAVDDYLSWQLERESHGWRWRAGEVKAGFQLVLDNGEVVSLEGRIDRIDDKLSTAETAVIDYKARAFAVLKQKLQEPGEDVQLPVYVALVDALDPERKITEAAYLSIERQSVRSAAYPDPESSGQHHVMRLQTLFEAMYAAAPLPAQGVDAICNFCEARGLCRRDYWVDVADDNDNHNDNDNDNDNDHE